MSELPEGLTQAQLDRYAQLDRGIKALAKEKEDLNAHIKQTFSLAEITGVHTMVFGAVVVKIGETSRLPKEAKEQLEEKYPESKFPKNWKSALDVTSLPKGVVDEFRVLGQTLSVDVIDGAPAQSPKRAAK